jgi:hypothetical protein
MNYGLMSAEYGLKGTEPSIIGNLFCILQSLLFDINYGYPE